MADLIGETMKKGVVQPSTSAWATPIVLVPKKDVYSLPRIVDAFDTLGKAHYFTTLDLPSRFWQIEMDPATQEIIYLHNPLWPPQVCHDAFRAL